MKIEKKWFVTVGMNAGEFAVKARDAYLAGEVFAGLFQLPPDKGAPVIAPIGDECYVESWYSHVEVRPATGELAEWLDAPKDDEVHTLEPGTYRAYGIRRLKVAGGWLYVGHIAARGMKEIGAAVSLTFVPVALASGITALEADDAS